MASSMKAFFYHNKSDERYLNKNLEQLHPTGTEPENGIPCIFKEDTDIIRPTLILNYNLVPNVNYVWISEVNRYYFVRNRVYSQGRTYIECEEDVLYTYRNQIKAQKVIVKRQANLYDLNMVDDEWTIEGYTATRTIPFPNGFNSTPEWVLGVAGGDMEDSNNGS